MREGGSWEGRREVDSRERRRELGREGHKGGMFYEKEVGMGEGGRKGHRGKGGGGGLMRVRGEPLSSPPLSPPPPSSFLEYQFRLSIDALFVHLFE